MVVGTPDIDHRFETATEFFQMVSNVRRKIGGVTVGANQDTVLIITKIGGSEPCGTVLLEGQALFCKQLETGRDFITVKQTLLTEPII